MLRFGSWPNTSSFVSVGRLFIMLDSLLDRGGEVECM